MGASDKIIELLEYEPKIKAEEGEVPPADKPVQGEISIKNLRFSYPTKSDVEVIRGITFDIPKNKVVALVGTSGCGKSSIISMIERFYEPTSGEV